MPRRLPERVFFSYVLWTSPGDGGKWMSEEVHSWTLARPNSRKHRGSEGAVGGKLSPNSLIPRSVIGELSLYGWRDSKGISEDVGG